MDGTSTEEIARKNVLVQVFQDISNFVASPLTTNGLNNKVNIWIRKITNVPNVPTSALGLATSFSNMPFNTTSGFGGIADNEVWKTIHLGKDSYTNVTPPISSYSSSNSGTSGIFFHGMMAINFSTYTWNTNLSVLANSTQYDLYTIVLHEVTHALGFASLLDQNGSSLFGTGYNYFSRYDRFLKNNANTAFLITNTSLCSMYNYTFNTNTSLITPTVIRPTCILPNNENTSNSINTTIQSNALKFVGSSINIPVYTPVCYESGSSLSHFEDTNFIPPAGYGFTSGNDLYFTMSNANGMGTNKRYLKREERLALLDLGYNVAASYGISTTLQGIPESGYYGVAATGITVAGINDGLNSNNTFTYIGNATVGNPIIINSSTDNTKQILFNDISATNFEFLQDITDNNAIFSATSGSLTTNITFSSAVFGLHLLRYVPYNATGKGNITYIYVYVSSTDPAYPSTCLPTPSVFNLVMNGGFEQNSGIPFDGSQLEKACGWYSICLGSPSNEYFNSSASSNNPINVSVPCNILGYQTINNGNGISYAGMGSMQTFFNLNLPFTEIISTKLITPLAINTNYQISFDVSLAEGGSSATMKFQSYLSELAINTATLQDYMPISNSNLLKESSSYSTNSNGWEKIILNVTTGTTPLQYLYLGALYNTQFQSRVPENAGLNGCNYYTDTNTGAFATGKYCYYYIDNVAVIPLNGASFVLPTSICANVILPNLTNYLASCPVNGVFAGNGVSYNSINGIYSFQFPNGVTSSTINYIYTNNLGYSITLQSIITVTNIIPTFTTIPVLCQGSTPPVLPTTSTNGITGSWSPSTVNTNTSGNYTFTPTLGQCASIVSVTITITPPTITPTFTTTPVLCQGSTPPVLPTTSINGITGTWNPSTVSTTTSGNYTFTPNAGQCAVSISRAIQVLSNTAFVANTDNFSVTLGTSVTTAVTTQSVRLNDTYNGGPIPTTIIGVPYTTVLVGTPPTITVGGIAFNASTGIFTVQPNTTEGTYAYQYKLQNNCYSTPVKTVKIIVYKISAPSRLLFNFCYSNSPSINSSTATPNQTLYNGTTLNGQPANSSNSTIVLVAPTTSLPSGISTINSNGSVTITQTLPGQLTFFYKICSGGACTGTISCDIYIQSTVWGQNDRITAAANGAVNYNVLSNDQYRGTCSGPGLVPATLSNVTISNIVNNLPYYSINPASGVIQTGIGTITSGTHLMQYTLCDTIYPTLCQIISVIITVP